MSLDIQWHWLTFDALSCDQLYELLRLRSEVFVVEQNCVFQDMDNLDQQAMHLLGVRVAAGSAQVKEEPAKRAGDTEQSPLPLSLPSEFVGQTNAELIAYVRCFPAGVTFDEASIGRVVTKPDTRGGGLGHLLMAEAVKALESEWGPQPIRIGAQAHLKSFYERHGFVDVGKPYIEDGIPHLEMLRGA
ncbi:GNAT family N-acetyltransferase [Rhodoferax mekongensis]|uniref:GNAT family N-acetyltransferase n=1 Tax=Rhodoferax mekongensis TaxID=3068341 RepID=A0ABZ0AVN5_9BURK|nr:GNAT family N-acetyltransferase [Rhodoferax sp. TBRC 17307]WNO03668.1 GNAT family N-acetyltransferase [Rhodoferax sp. TBRC 17307]